MKNKTINKKTQKINSNKSHKLTKKSRSSWIKCLISIIVILFLGGYLFIKNRIFADTLTDQFLTALKDKMGFEYDPDPVSNYVFRKVTPNYNAFSGDKKSGGNNRILLERSGIFMEAKFLAAEIYKDKSDINPQTPSDLNVESLTSADLTEKSTYEIMLDNINRQIEEINVGFNDVSQKIAEIEKEVSNITSKAKMVAGDKGQKVAYENLVYGIDVNYSLNEAGMKQEIVIKNKDKIKNFFTFSLLIPNLTYEDVGHGVWYFFNKEGEKIMRISKPWAVDGDNKFTNDVEIKIESYFLINQMTIKVPLTWLEDPSRIYPVTVYAGFEIVPELRDGKSIGPSITPGAGEVTPYPEVSNSAVTNATDSSILTP